MAVKNYIKRTVKENTNVRDWASWNAIKANGQTVKNLVKDFGAPDQSTEYVAGSFDDAVKHYGLTENDLKKRMRSHLIIALACCGLGLLAFMWTIYLVAAKAMYLTAVVGLALTALMLTYAFREHFFYYKIKQRRLHCTVKEWLKSFKPGQRNN